MLLVFVVIYVIVFVLVFAVIVVSSVGIKLKKKAKLHNKLSFNRLVVVVVVDAVVL